jgi:polyisoprenoid-binding protein YceI
VSRGILTTLIVVVLLAVVGGAAWFFLTDNAEITETAQEGAEELAAETPSDVVFRIDPERSTAEFRIDEVLRGEDVTVVGTTNQIAADIRVNQENPSASEIGEVRINARALETDETNRNRALRQVILRSSEDEFEFITFEPTALQNMPEAVTVGEAFEFQIVGNLTIIETTTEVTFDATVTPTSETEIEGSATTTILYPEWNLTIPEVPFVASVEDEVILALNFVATEVDAAAEAETEAEAPAEEAEEAIADPEATEEAN